MPRPSLTFEAVAESAEDMPDIYRMGSPGRFRYAVIRYGRGFIVAQWHSGHSNWTVGDLAGGCGYGSTPELAAGQCRRPDVVTLRQARDEIAGYMAEAQA